MNFQNKRVSRSGKKRQRLSDRALGMFTKGDTSQNMMKAIAAGCKINDMYL